MPGRLTSPYFVLRRRGSSTYNRVRLRPAAPSCLVWLVTHPGTERRHGLVGRLGAQCEPRDSGGLGPASPEASECNGAAAGAPPQFK